jgi:hypothetical protein
LLPILAPIQSEKVSELLLPMNTLDFSRNEGGEYNNNKKDYSDRYSDPGDYSKKKDRTKDPTPANKVISNDEGLEQCERQHEAYAADLISGNDKGPRHEASIMDLIPVNDNTRDILSGLRHCEAYIMDQNSLRMNSTKGPRHYEAYTADLNSN